MIIELFGPSGAGKTTFASKLAAGLRARGWDAVTVISARASEATDETDTLRARGVPRPSGAGGEGLNHALMRLLPPRNWLWDVRLRRYLRRLASAWARGEVTPGFVIFDQGYTQALCSLIALTRSKGPDAVRDALDLLPEPAFRIALQVPEDLRAARLRERAKGLSPLQRVRELDATTTFRHDAICAMLFEALRDRAPIIRTTSTATMILDPLLDHIIQTLTQTERRAVRPALASR